jgi:hypothetical protein
MEELIKLLREHESLAFPAGYHGKTIEGVNLTIVNSECLGLIYGLVETQGSMSSRSKQTIAKHIKSLTELIEKLSNENATERKEHPLIGYSKSLLTLISAIGLEYGSH